MIPSAFKIIIRFFFTLLLFRRWVHSHSISGFQVSLLLFSGYYVGTFSCFVRMHDFENKIWFYRICLFGCCRMAITHGGYEVSTLEYAAIFNMSERVACGHVYKHMYIPNHNRMT